MKKILKFKYVILIICLIIILIMVIPEQKNLENNYSDLQILESISEPIENKELPQEIKKVKVDIKGYVVNPGVYEIEENAKVIDVINIAGGMLENADTSRINLAKTVKDEMVIIIYSKKEIETYLNSKNKVETKIEYVYVETPCECPDNKKNDVCLNEDDLIANEIPSKEEIKNENKEETKKLVSLNNATKEELMTLPSIGESKANSIIEYRKTTEFKSIDDIKNVNGIGEALFEKIKDSITI